MISKGSTMASFVVIEVAGCVALRHLKAINGTVTGAVAIEQWRDKQ